MNIHPIALPAFMETGLSGFIFYILAAFALAALFVAIYIRITPYKEISLIREGNSAAAVSLSGALLGFSLPLASAIAHSASLPNMAFWALAGLAVQVIAFFIARLALPSLDTDIPKGQMSSAIFLAAVSLGIGLVSAACMTP